MLEKRVSKNHDSSMNHHNFTTKTPSQNKHFFQNHP